MKCLCSIAMTAFTFTILSSFLSFFVFVLLRGGGGGREGGGGRGGGNE